MKKSFSLVSLFIIFLIISISFGFSQRGWATITVIENGKVITIGDDGKPQTREETPAERRARIKKDLAEEKEIDAEEKAEREAEMRSNGSFKLLEEANSRSKDLETNACLLRTTEAEKICDPENRTAVGTIGNVSDQLLGMGNTMAASTPEMACSNMGKILMAASGALLGYKAACTAKYISCASACSSAVKEQDAIVKDLKGKVRVNLASSVGFEDALKVERETYTELIRAQNKCANNSQRLQAAVGNVTVLIQQGMRARQCQKDALSDMEKFCKENPKEPICGNSIVDCNDAATRASNTICICQSNPTDSRCGNSDLYAGTNRNGNSADNNFDSGLGANQLGLGNSFGGGGDDDDIAQARPPSPPGGTLGHGGSGGGGGRLGDGTGKAPNRGGGGGGDPVNTKINGGFLGGGSGGSSLAGRGYGGNENSGTNGGTQQKGLDLNQFLPKGKLDPTRGLASATGPDGITGPNTNIWTKIKTRYFTLAPGLRP